MDRIECLFNEIKELTDMSNDEKSNQNKKTCPFCVALKTIIAVAALYGIWKAYKEVKENGTIIPCKKCHDKHCCSKDPSICDDDPEE